jgi:hypothetical protein
VNLGTKTREKPKGGEGERYIIKKDNRNEE